MGHHVRSRPVIAISVLATLTACSDGGTKATSTSTGSTPAVSSTAGSSATASSANEIALGTDDPCALLSAAEAATVVGGSSFTQVMQPYDVAQALANLDQTEGTNRAAGFQGHATVCANGSTSEPDDSVSETLFTDSGTVNSFTAFGYGKSSTYDLTSTLGVKAESNPANSYIAAVLDDKHWILGYARQDGHGSVDLGVAATRVILDKLR